MIVQPSLRQRPSKEAAAVSAPGLLRGPCRAQRGLSTASCRSIRIRAVPSGKRSMVILGLSLGCADRAGITSSDQATEERDQEGNAGIMNRLTRIFALAAA